VDDLYDMGIQSPHTSYLYEELMRSAEESPRLVRRSSSEVSQDLKGRIKERFLN